MVSALDSGFRVRALAGAFFYVLGQDTLLSQCLSAPRCENISIVELLGNADKMRRDRLP